MKTIRNKKTGEILQVSEGDLAKYGLGGQTHSSKGKKVLRSFQQGGIRDYLFSKGVDGSKANRTKLFNKYFDGKYTGTAEQNIKLLSDIKSGKIKINGNINPWTNTGAKADTKKQTPIKVNPWSNIGERAQAEQTGQKAKTNIASTAFKVPAKTAIKVNPWSNAGAKAQPFKKSPELESGVIVDKRTGQAYTIKDKKVAYNFPVLTGQNVESNENLKSLPSQMTYVDKATPIGSYIMNNNISTINKDSYKGLIKNLSPVPAYGMSAPLAKSLAIHQTYNPEVRNALYNTINPYASYGCVNCKPEDIKKLIGDFPQSDTMRVIDSKMPEGREILDQYNIKPKPGFYQGGGGYTDKTGSHFNIKNFFNQNNQTSLNDCPIGYKWSVADQQCLPDDQVYSSNFSGDRNKFITGTINQNGEKVGGTNAQPTMSHQPNASNNNYINNSDMNLKRVFGTPNIPAILASNLLLSGLSAFGNNVEEGRQKSFAMNQLNNPAFNQTYSYAQPVYGSDPYEQTGQKRKTIFQMGGLKFYDKSNTPQGSTTPTGQSSLSNNSELSPQQITDIAKKYGFRTDNNKNFQEDLFSYAQKNQPETFNKLFEKFGQTNAGTYVDGLLGARTLSLVEQLNNLESIQQTSPQTSISKKDLPRQADLTEHLFDSNKHGLGRASRKYVDSQGITDAGILDQYGKNPEFVDFSFYKKDSNEIDPTRGRYKIPNDIYQNQIIKGTNTVYDQSLFDKYKIPQQKKGGKFKMQDGGGFNVYDFLYGDDEDTTQKKSNDTTKNKKRVTESEVDDSQAQLEAIGLSDMDILNMPSLIRRNISSEEYSPDSSSNYSSQGSNNYGELYLQHQQGATGIRLIKQAAEQGLDAVPRSWSKENIQSNMRNNVSGDFKGPVTPAKFLEYWNGKMNRHMAKMANKETPYDSIFQKVGQEEGINPLFLKAVANIESGINPNNNTKSKYKGITALNYNTYGKKVFDPYFSLSTTAKSFKQEGGTYSTEDISKLPSNFAMGGVFELNESDIQRLIKQGYKIDRL